MSIFSENNGVMFMKGFMCVAAVALPCLLAACGSPDSQQAERADQGVAHIRVDSTRHWVSIDANHASVQSVLLDLSEQAGFSLTVSDGDELGHVTIAVKNISIEEGIQRVLGTIPYTLRHAMGENGLKVVAAVDVRRGISDTSGSDPLVSATTSTETRTSDSGWGADRGSDRGVAADSDRAAELAATLDDLSPDTVKQLMNETKDPAIRASMLDALTERNDQNSIRPLFLDALKDVDVDVRNAALEHLQSSYDPVPLAPLADAVVRETNTDLRIDAMEFLSDQALMDGRTSQDVMAATASITLALTDPDPAVRGQAQWSLEELSQAGN